jgi:hypothetical protein
MPNWCYNYLSVEGPQEDIAKLKAQLNKPFTKVHDQYNPDTHKMEMKEYSYSNPIFAFHNIYNHTQAGITDEQYNQQPDHSLSIQEAMKFGGNHWYDFNVREWGTKWDVAVGDEDKWPETELYAETDNELGYKFNTAWSPPLSGIEKLVEQYPTLNFNLSYEEETGWGGEVEYEEGVQTMHNEYGWKCRECDNEEEDSPYCEECEFDTCPSCGYNESDEPCDQHKEEVNA